MRISSSAAVRSNAAAPSSARIGNAPVDGLRVAGELGTHLAHAIAQTDDEVEALRREFLQMFGAATAEIDAALAHDADRLRVERLGVAAGAVYLNCSMRKMLQQAFGHLRPRAIAGAQKQHSHGCPVSRAALDPRWRQAQPWMEQPASGSQQLTATGEVHTVVRVARIG